MTKPRPVPRPSSDDIRRMMFVTWGELIESGWLTDIDRATALYGVVADPYHEVAFAGLDDMDKARICIDRMLEEHQWDKAFRAISRLPRLERELIAADNGRIDPLDATVRPPPRPRPARPMPPAPAPAAAPPPARPAPAPRAPLAPDG